MQKIWYVRILGFQEGPYSFEDLQKDIRLTPDTLVWKEGFEDWMPIRKVPELRNLFNIEVNTSDEEFEKEKELLLQPQEELTLNLEQEPHFFFFWILLALLILVYIINEIYS